MDDHQLGPGGGSPTKRVKRDTTETAGKPVGTRFEQTWPHVPSGWAREGGTVGSWWQAVNRARGHHIIYSRDKLFSNTPLE